MNLQFAVNARMTPAGSFDANARSCTAPQELTQCISRPRAFLQPLLPRSCPGAIVNQRRQARAASRRLAWRSLIDLIFTPSGDLETSNLLVLLPRSCPDTIVNRRRQATAASRRLAPSRIDSIVVVEVDDNLSRSTRLARNRAEFRMLARSLIDSIVVVEVDDNRSRAESRRLARSLKDSIVVVEVETRLARNPARVVSRRLA